MKQDLDLSLDDYPFDTKCSETDKAMYGEIYTPRSLVEKILDMLPADCFVDPNTTWLDPGSGTGHFFIVLYHRLMDGLQNAIPNPSSRKNHIIGKMLYMIELKPSNVERLRAIFGVNANIIENDFTTMSNNMSFDFVIGNPPYNADGIKKVPTNSVKHKKKDGRTIWTSFVRRGMSLLHPMGRLLFIIPSIWMKPDRAGMYNFMTGHRLEKIVCMSSGETNSAFKGAAQTPTCCVLVRNATSNGHVELFDKDMGLYIKYVLSPNRAIPIYGAGIVNKLLGIIAYSGSLAVNKTNMPPTGTKVSNIKTDICPYVNIRTCILDKTTPILQLEYSDRKLAFAGIPKLVLAHKMYGFPYLDLEGKFGISNRDAYVISGRSINELERICAFLRTRIVLYIFEAARYRMRYLERYAFEFLPDIASLSDFPTEINDLSVANYLGLDDKEREYVFSFHRKNYSSIPLLSSQQN